MTHFLVELTYTAPLEAIDAAVADHRAYLQTGYDRGLLLMSGPQNPKVGGLIVCRAASRDEIERYFAEDPFQKRGLATYRFVEFNPVKHQPFVGEWIAG